MQFAIHYLWYWRGQFDKLSRLLVLLLIISSVLATFMLVKSLFFLKHRKFLLISCWKMWLADQCLTWQQLNKLQERLCIVMICPSMQVSFSGKKIVGKLQCELLLAYCPWLCGRLSLGLSTLGDRKPVPGYWHKMVSCSHFEYPICDCVHSYSISPCQMPLWNISLWQREQSSGLQGTYKNCVHRGTQCPLLCPSTRWRP